MAFPGFPNDQGSSASAVPVWLDTAPIPDSQGRFGNDPRVTGGAVPIFFVGGPGLYPAFPGYATDQGQMIAAVPVRICSQPDPNGPLATDPSLDQSAKPVWDTGGAPPEASAYPNAQNSAAGAVPVYRVN